VTIFLQDKAGMKIKEITTFLFKAPLKTPFKTALRRVDSLEDLVVVIACEDGSIGYGEGAPAPAITGETVDSMIAAIEHIKPLLIGLEIEEFDTALDKIHHSIPKNTTAKSALEIALYDLKSKALNLPLYRMLGGTQTTFKTDITISMNETDTMVRDSLEALARGYEILKVKIGDNPQKDIRRVKAIWDAVGKQATLRLDANQGWSAVQSVQVLQTLESAGIVAECIEQPVKADDLAGLKYIKERVQTPLLADESVFSAKDAVALLECQAVDYINIKLAKTGGISGALKLADIAHDYGVKCMLGCMLEGPFSIAAGVHVASAKADIITMIDLDAVSLLSYNPAKTSVRFEESRITLSGEAGIGVSILA